MTLRGFLDRLDRCGSALSRWPFDDMRRGHGLLATSEDARRAHALARRLEDGIAASRPSVSRGRAPSIVARTMVEIARIESRPAASNTFRPLLLNPMLRAALMVTITAIGYAMGLALSPDLGNHKDAATGSFMAASLDDVSY